MRNVTLMFGVSGKEMFDDETMKGVEMMEETVRDGNKKIEMREKMRLMEYVTR